MIGRRGVLAGLLVGPLAGCMVGGLRPMIADRFREVAIDGDGLAGTFDDADRRRFAATARIVVDDVFARAVEAGNPALPRLEIALVALHLAERPIATAAGPFRPDPAKDVAVAEWRFAPAAGGHGPLRRTQVERVLDLDAAGRFREERGERTDFLAARLVDRIWDDLRHG